MQQQQMDQQKKLDLQKIAQAKQMMLGEKFGEKLNTEKFPADKLSAHWRMATNAAINFTAPYHHKLPLAQFADVVNNSDEHDLTLFQFGVLSNSLEMVSPHQLGFSNEMYQELINEAVGHISWYGNLIAEIRKEVELEVESEFKLKEVMENKGNLKVAEA